MKSPSVDLTAFACPYCGAFTSQQWFTVYGSKMAQGHSPFIPTPEFIEEVKANPEIDDNKTSQTINWAKRMMRGRPFMAAQNCYMDTEVENLFVSQCFECQEMAIWVGSRLIFPSATTAPRATADMPGDITAIFEEARLIVGESPRGAAALLRLCVQLLCKALGESGKNIDEDIASLVRKGLNPTVQKSLDIVRVIGNESVHPGTIDIKDDPDTAQALFRLINTIVEQMISHPKHVAELYEKLPEAKRKAIERRDGKSARSP